VSPEVQAAAKRDAAARAGAAAAAAERQAAMVDRPAAREQPHQSQQADPRLRRDVMDLLGLVDPAGGSLLASGLSVVDCARLSAASKGCHAAVASNTCWRDALAALEADFPFVSDPDPDDDEVGRCRLTPG
jgi:hypothetical protein